MTVVNDKELAGIEYHGLAGITQACVNAVARLIQCGAWITKATLLTCNSNHAFLLQVDEGDYIAIKAGFTSGYSGEGPRGLAAVLQLFKRHSIEIEELEVLQDVISRVDISSLTISDIHSIETSKRIRPSRWHDYIYDVTRSPGPSESRLNEFFPTLVPFRLIDTRIIDLAIMLPAQPDAAIMGGYRRLEQIVAKRCGLIGTIGSKLFARAFQADDSQLYWQDTDIAEAKGRASLFLGAYSAYRNRRAHQELPRNAVEEAREFLLLNELYLLEASAVSRPC